MRRMNKLFLQSRLRHYLMRKIFPQIHSRIPLIPSTNLREKTYLSTQILQTNCVRIAGISYISINYWKDTRHIYVQLSPVKRGVNKIMCGSWDIVNSKYQIAGKRSRSKKKNMVKNMNSCRPPSNELMTSVVMPGQTHSARHRLARRKTTPADYDNPKLVSSFYDGRRKVRMSSKELRNYVIFIDEFDYQAEVLQEYLAQAQWVQEPPECLGQLLEGDADYCNECSMLKQHLHRWSVNVLGHFLTNWMRP